MVQMSELKVRLLGQTMNEYGCDTKIYLKSEVDKVIAELEKNLSEIQSQKMQLEDDVALLRRNNAELKKACNDKDDWCLHTLKENRHHKYKRCFKMARWCISMMVFNSKYGTDKKWHHFKKWHERWLVLAEKFKEVK